MRARQRKLGVDMDCIDQGFDCYEELFAEVQTTRASS
ncbi:hypothetical protein SAMN05443287_10613 [Micromonospora phaseoli]|uniref:Uncharacterized protein n=1 Tax=Micromonospora phaseoli TaxID=1144548 RepID=A0A1H7AA49_9ACTN|nr:hypothetical protein CLV64_107375 [Micromonospora phaseoli]SEJ62509.1 hypothetical protein SAMN05443287_10613 [Micromonospora phaseoli]